MHHLNPRYFFVLLFWQKKIQENPVYDISAVTILSIDYGDIKFWICNQLWIYSAWTFSSFDKSSIKLGVYLRNFHFYSFENLYQKHNCLILMEISPNVSINITFKEKIVQKKDTVAFASLQDIKKNVITSNNSQGKKKWETFQFLIMPTITWNNQ